MKRANFEVKAGLQKESLRRLFSEIARADELRTTTLARALGLPPAALESKLRLLERKGLVHFQPGRKRIGLNPEYGCVVALDLGASHLHYALADFTGEIIRDATEKVQPEDGPKKLIRQIQEQIKRFLDEGQRRSPLALAIGVPSPVDNESGVVAWANNLPGWEKIHLRRELEKQFRVPIFLENDANMAAIGEHWRGVAQGVENFVFVALGTGIGAGVFIDGKLYRGRTGSAGELFRMNLEWPRWNEEFPDTGYFENFVSGLGIAAEGRKTLGASLPAKPPSLREERDAFFVFEAYRQGNSHAAGVLEKAFTMLGVAMANVVAVLDPELIVLGGGIAQGAPDLMLAIVEKVVRRIQGELTPPIKLSSLGDKAQTYGAIRSALDAANLPIARDIR